MIQNHQGQAPDATCKEELREAQRLRKPILQLRGTGRPVSILTGYPFLTLRMASGSLYFRSLVPRSDEPDILTLLRSALTEGKP